MNEITLLTLVSFLSLSFISFSVLAGTGSYMDEAMKHTEAAMSSTDKKAIVQHATEAITHANAAKNDQQHNVDANYIDEGLRSLDEAVKEGNNGEVEAAQEAARKAYEHFKRASSIIPRSYH